METSPRNAGTPLDTLLALLTTAQSMLEDFASDPLLGRVTRAFATFPETDREPILRILERDATWTRIVQGTSVTTGITVRPNPHASLYVHVFDPVTGQPVEPEPLARDANVMRVGIERFVRVLPLLFQDGVYAQWSPAAREVARSAEPELRAAAARLAREVLALIAEAEGDENRV